MPKSAPEALGFFGGDGRDGGGGETTWRLGVELSESRRTRANSERSSPSMSG